MTALEPQAEGRLPGFRDLTVLGDPRAPHPLSKFSPPRWARSLSSGSGIIGAYLLSHLSRSWASASTPRGRSPCSRYEKGRIHSGLAAGPLRKPPRPSAQQPSTSATQANARAATPGSPVPAATTGHGVRIDGRGPAPNALCPQGIFNSPHTFQFPHTSSLLPKMYPCL